MIEFLGMLVLLGLPAVYLVVALSGVQTAALAVVTISEQLARVRAQSPDAAVGQARLDIAKQELSEAAGVDPQDVKVSLACGGGCDEPGANVSVTVRISVRLPLMPGGVGEVEAASSVVRPRYA